MWELNANRGNCESMSYWDGRIWKMKNNDEIRGIIKTMIKEDRTQEDEKDRQNSEAWNILGY